MRYLVRKFVKGLVKRLIINSCYKLSVSEEYALEISGVKTCSIRCDYCPQNQLIAANKRIPNTNLKLETFYQCLKNIEGMILSIHWTGYSEACLNPDFPEMVELAHRNGFGQEISTTLVGHKRCIDFLGKTNIFSVISLHLPDDKGMMEKGALKVNNDYLNRLEKFLDIRACSESTTKIKTVTFGEKYHPDIEKILRKNRYTKLIITQKRLINLHSRAGAIDKDRFSRFNLRIGAKILQNSLSKSKSFMENIKLPLYYCSYKRLNHPVLIGSGLLNICCMDYGLKCIKGDLSSAHIMRIEKKWRARNLIKFCFGKLEPCKNCEHYKKLSLLDYIQNFTT